MNANKNGLLRIEDGMALYLRRENGDNVEQLTVDHVIARGTKRVEAMCCWWGSTKRDRFRAVFEERDGLVRMGASGVVFRSYMRAMRFDYKLIKK